jgi:hypothetical protein
MASESPNGCEGGNFRDDKNWINLESRAAVSLENFFSISAPSSSLAKRTFKADYNQIGANYRGKNMTAK